MGALSIIGFYDSVVTGFVLRHAFCVMTVKHFFINFDLEARQLLTSTKSRKSSKLDLCKARVYHISDTILL